MSSSAAPPPDRASPGEAFPPGLNNVFGFAIFNALSFQIVLGSPMVLYAKSLGASSTVLGIIAGMMPLLVIFQIPAASHIARVGYQRFVLGGWALRVLFIFGLAAVPLLGAFLDATNRLALVLMLLFGFNLSRGISSAAWLPWITAIVPASLRGRYLAREAAFGNIGSFLAFLLAAVMLGREPAAWRFAVAFGFSAVMGAASLAFLKRIPETQAPDEARASGAPVPWRAIAGYPPFRRLLWLNLAWAVAFGSVGTFVVAWLKTRAGMADNAIMTVNSAYFIGGLCSLGLLGARLDRFGSKPVLSFALGSWVLIVMGWASLASGAAATSLVPVIALQFLMGLAAASVQMANTRLAMAIAPTMGRSHFFALFSVVQNLTLGLAPILWGVMIDALGGLHLAWHGWEWNAFSVYFAGLTASFLVTLLLVRPLHEPAAARTEELVREILITSPQRLWLRVWPRG
jgi:MFS family permease